MPPVQHVLGGAAMDFRARFIQNFIEDNRWQYITDGLRNTLIITVFALVLGVALGFLIALVRVTHDLSGRLNWLDRLARLYLTVIRGTPVLVQLMIIYYVIFASVTISPVVTAIIGFGINSGAYVAEIFRGGIMSIDPGQTEAGRSLGLSHGQTMWRIIMPQAVKNVLPALGNESISLLKETSVAGYIAIQDLTKGGDIIRSRTYEPFLPLIAVAIIYLIIVLFLQEAVRRMERRLAVSDRR
jgi:His/Glu/Gln/Arg/opine family amino acid ABC transporter permease subunit